MILYDNMPAHTLEKEVTFACDVMFERKSPTATMQEAARFEQIDLRIFGRPVMPNTRDETNAE